LELGILELNSDPAISFPISLIPKNFKIYSLKRLLSLDFMRGLIMVLLALESAGLFDHFPRQLKEIR
jgi:predicted acyltransferase